MPRYNSGNFSFVIDSHFQPFSMQEMLVPFMAYKDAYERSEEAYQNLSEKADVFKDLANSLPEESKARQIYEGYANELHQQADDLARNGLSMSNRRALQSLKRRYQGEIGLLNQAKSRMDEENKIRRELSIKDPSYLWATDSYTIDDFLEGNNPNLYGVSGDALYAKGATAGKAASSRIYHVGEGGKTLGGYYRTWVEQYGYSPESINAFRRDASAIPELQEAADAILKSSGVYDNLSGSSLERARAQVINGIVDGAVYSQEVKPMRDEGVPSAYQAANLALAKQEYADKRAATYDIDPTTGRVIGVKATTGSKSGKSGKNGGTGSSGSSTVHETQMDKPIRLKWNGNEPSEDDELAVSPEVEEIATDDKTRGVPKSYGELPNYARDMVDKIIGSVGRGETDYYDYYFKPYKWGLFGDDEATLEIIPRKIVTDDKEDSIGDYGI